MLGSTALHFVYVNAGEHVQTENLNVHMRPDIPVLPLHLILPANKYGVPLGCALFSHL